MFTGSQVTVTTQLSTAAAKGWRTASEPASQAEALGHGHGDIPEGKLSLPAEGGLLQSCVRLLGEAKAL